MKRFVLYILTSLLFIQGKAQSITGLVTDRSGKGIEFAAVALSGSSSGTNTNSKGQFTLSGISNGQHVLKIVAVGFSPKEMKVSVPLVKPLNIVLAANENSLNEVVVTGTMKEMSKDESPMNID